MVFFVGGMLCAQNKISVIRPSILTTNSEGGGAFYHQNKIVFSSSGNLSSDSNKPYHLTFLFNADLDTLQTSTKKLSGSISNNSFYLSPFGANRANEMFYSGFSDNYSGIADAHIFAKSTVTNLSLMNYKAYKSKNICYPGINNRQLINDSTFIVTRSFKYAVSFNQNNFSLWWINRNLDTLNQKVYINNKNCFAKNVIPLPSKDLLVYGETDSIDVNDSFIMRIDSVGNIKWVNSYGTSSYDGHRLIRLNNYFYLIGGSDLLSICTTTLSTILVTKLDENGVILKTTKIETNRKVVISQLQIIGNDFVIAGSSCNSFTSGYSGVFLKVDTNGVIKNQYIIGQNQTNFENFLPYEITSDSLKNIYCAASSWTGGGNPIYQDNLIKLDSNLTGCYPSEPAFNFTTTVAPPGFLHNIPIHFRVAKDSIYEVFGTINQGYGFNTLVDECSGYVGLQEHVKQNQHFKIYPNPSTGLFYYEYNAEENNNEPATLTVIDMLGKVRINGTIDQANAKGMINLSELNNGIYFITISNSKKQLFANKLSVIK
ncbi:MAG: T9SS type A sorting domain-containing protein [Bacteroidota bacterium]